MGGLYPDDPWESFTDLIDAFVTEVRDFTAKPIIVTQTGTPLGDSRSLAWLNDAVFYTLNYTNIDGFIYYNENEFKWGPGRDDFNDRMQPLDATRPDHWFEEEEEIMPFYPKAMEGESAEIYGTLPDHGQTKVALVYHTTETAGFPGFSENDVAPHYVYAPQTRKWTRMAEYEDGYVGTLKGHTTGGHGNCKAFQVEILGYSAQYDRHGNPNHPWVGDFTDENYQDLADFWRWARDRYHMDNTVTPTPNNGWLYGTGSAYRMTDTAWANFGGLTAHGAVPRNSHWDTGILDLGRIHNLSQEGGGLVDIGRNIEYVREGQTGQDVEYWQVRMIEAIEKVQFYGNSNREFVEAEAPQLTFKVWDAAMTAYLSGFTGRNSYGVGATERVMLENAIDELYN